MNLQTPTLSARSVNQYSIDVTPLLNELPGACVELRRITVPELSIAVGGIQDTLTDSVPNGTSSNMLFGQPLISGGVVSSVRIVKETTLIYLNSYLLALLHDPQITCKLQEEKKKEKQ